MKKDTECASSRQLLLQRTVLFSVYYTVLYCNVVAEDLLYCTVVAEDWTLRISPVLLEDDAMFQCQVGAAEGVAPIRSRSAQLTVSLHFTPSNIFYV